MEDYPRTVLELEDRFATEEDCWDYMLKLSTSVYAGQGPTIIELGSLP
jgi:hypothetical protein